MKGIATVLLIALVLLCSSAQAGVVADSRIESVTVYRGQALVTREVTLPAKAGELELVVSDLPGQIIGSSLSASGGDGVQIRSVRYRTEATADAVREEVAALDAKIKELRLQQHAQGLKEQRLQTRARHIEKLEGFTAPTAQVELSKGVLNAETLQAVSGYIMKQRDALMVEQLAWYKESQDLAEKMSLLQRQRGELVAGHGRTKRSALIFVTNPGDTPATIHLTYLVNSASWSPAYNVRLKDDGKDVRIEYLANVSQASGEDWTGVKLTLSTATPAMNAMTPILAPMWIDLQGVAGKDQTSLGTWNYGRYAQSVQENTKQQFDLLNAYNTFADGASVDDANWGLNQVAATFQEMELNVNKDLVRTTRAGMAEVLAVSYELSGSMTLPSRSDRQLVQIEKLQFTGSPYYEAIPLLSSYVYRNVRVQNETPLPLLAGPYSAYMGGDFVGRGTLPLVARGQDIAIGFGVDTQLRCRRELVDKSDTISWGSRVQGFHYRLRLENFKSESVNVRLIDRIPASKGSDLKVTLGRLTDELSSDAVYVRDQKDRGILRWDVALTAGATGANVRQVDYRFEMKYAKDVHVGRQATGKMDAMEADLRKSIMLSR